MLSTCGAPHHYYHWRHASARTMAINKGLNNSNASLHFIYKSPSQDINAINSRMVAVYRKFHLSIIAPLCNHVALCRSVSMLGDIKRPDVVHEHSSREKCKNAHITM